MVGMTPSISDTEASVEGGEAADMTEGVGRTKLAGIEPCDADGRICGIGSKSS